MNNKYNNEKVKEGQSNSYFFSFFDNKKNKTLYLEEISKISKNKKRTININSNKNFNDSKDFQSNILKNIFSSNELEPIKKKKCSIQLNTLNYINNKSSNVKISNTDKNIPNGRVQNNTKKKMNYYIGHNSLTLNEQLAYPCFNSYIFAKVKRFETTEQFMYKTRLMVLDKYIQNISKNAYLKQITSNENIFEKQVLNKRTLELMKKLFFSYNKTLDEYLRYLFKRFREMNEENERLKQNIIKISMDIEQMRQQMIRGLTLINEGYAIKFFLMCVKNHTLNKEKFVAEDIEKIENDRLKLNESYYLLNNKSKTRKRKNSRKNSLYFNKNIKKSNNNIFFKEGNINKDKNNLENFKSTLTLKKSSPFVFDSIEDFFEHFDAITTKLNLLIKENNDKYENNKYLKLKLSFITKSTEGQRKECVLLGNKIKSCEQNLEILKLKNKKLSSQLDGYRDNKFKTEVKLALVLKNIYNIYNNIFRIVSNFFGI